MINVYSKQTTTFNNNGLATLIPISAEFKPGINGAWQYILEHPFDKEQRYMYLEKEAILRVTGIDRVREWESTNQLFRIYNTKRNLTSITVIACPIAMESNYDAPIDSLVITDKTGIQAASALDTYVREHGNSKYTISSNISRTARTQLENTNLIAAISGSDDNSFVNKWGGEVIYDNYKIKIQDKVGNYNSDHPYSVRYGRNLTGLSHEEDYSSVVTRLYPISSDDLRLNTWADVTDQGGNPYVDTSEAHTALYPFTRAMFVDLNYKLIDTDTNSHTVTSDSTETWRVGMTNTMLAIAQSLWNTVCNDTTNYYNAGYIKSLISGDGGIPDYLQRKFVFAHKGWQSFVKSCAKQSVEWIKSADVPTWEWHENTSVIPHAWWYGDDSVSPATSYAKNCYVKIGKNWEYFNNDGFWEDYKAIPNADMDWYEAQDGSGKKWYGYRKGYYAHNEYVYMTVEGQMKEWWYDEEGWHDESRSGDSDMGWHGDATSGYWFGEADATSEDTNKFLHDRWAWIDGNYYWFDSHGYISGELDIPDYPWFVIDTTQGSWFGNDQDKMLGAKWLSNQWAKIDGEWYYFDADGYVVDMVAKESEMIAWFANSVYNGSIDYIKTQLTSAYTLLYQQMTTWCNRQFELGIDMPTINVSVDLIDLSKTTAYAEYADLEKVCLGDKVLVIGRDGSKYEERVVGLTYDCLRGYNTHVEVGQLSKTVGQIISTSFKGSDSADTKLIAGDNVVIDGKVISVGDYVGRTVGLQDVLLNGSTTVSGNVASFGIQAGENISISRDGNILTINAVGGGGDVSLYHGIDIPDNSLGDDKDIYLQMESTVGNLLSFDASNSGTSITNYSATETNRKWDITATFVDNWEYHSFNIYSLQNLTVGKKYTISFDFQNDGVPPLYGIGELFGLTLQHTNRFIDMRSWSSDLVENGEFKYFADSYYGEWWYQSFPNDTKRVHYEFEFTARQGTEYIGFYGDRTSGNLTCSLYELCVGEREETNEIKDVFYKINEEWLLYEAYESGDNITIVDGVISATDTDEIAELEDVSLTNLADGEILKYNATTQKWENAEDSGGSEVEANPSGTATDTLTKLGIDGTVYEIQGGGGGTGGSSVYSEKVLYKASDNTFTNIQVDFAEDYDAYIFYCNDVITQKSESYYYVKSEIEEAIKDNILISMYPYGSEGYCQYNISNSGLTTLTNRAGFFIYKIVGLKFGTLSPIIYSTEEREVGVGENNKPLYQKTIESGSIPADSVVTTGLTNIESYHVIAIEVINLSNNTEYAPSQISMYNYQGVGTWYGNVFLANNELKINNNSRTNVIKVRAVIQYTKTTDTAGSASYTTLGVPAHHYDSNEKIIGTWFGETLYEKTIHLTEASEVVTNQYTTEIQSLNVDKVFLVNGRIKLGSAGGGVWVNSPYYNSNNYNTSIGVTNTEITVVATGWKYTEAELTIQYTKTS